MLRHDSSISFKSKVKNRRDSNSYAEPRLILRKWAKSLFVFLPQPSAMFVEIEIDALLICELKPYLSSEGNSELNSYIPFTNCLESCHTLSSLKLCIILIYLCLAAYFLLLMSCYLRLIQKLINPGNPLSATHTGCYHAIFLLLPPHFIEQLYRQSRPGRSQRVAYGNGPSVNI